MESIQCNAALAITDAIRGTSREKLYQELGLESHRKNDGIENSATVTFSKYLKVNHRSISSEYFLAVVNYSK